MKTHHTSLYNDKNNQPTVPVLRQELTWVETDFGLVKTTMTVLMMVTLTHTHLNE